MTQPEWLKGGESRSDSVSGLSYSNFNQQWQFAMEADPKWQEELLRAELSDGWVIIWQK